MIIWYGKHLVRPSMSLRWKKEIFQQLMEFERGRVIELQEGGFSYRTIAACMQRNDSIVMWVWKQWTDEHQTSPNNWQWTVEGDISTKGSPPALHGDEWLCIASSRQLAACWSTVTDVLMSASSICRRLLHHELHAKMPLYRIPLTENHRRLWLQWAQEHRACQADWHEVFFSDESCFNLWNHDGLVRK